VPTIRGIVFGVAAVVFLLCGWYYSRIELYALGVAAAAALGSALLYVHAGRLQLSAKRRVTPAQVHFGAASTVELALVNRSRRTVQCLAADAFIDPARSRAVIGPLRGDTVLLDVPPIGRGETARASYRPSTDKRGRFRVGPLTLRREDPFGLVVQARRLLDDSELIVFPEIHTISPMAAVPAQDLESKLVRSAAGLDGDEFFALRPYQMGDDLRRAHWPTTARTDELMIRQLEPPREQRATVLLDVAAKTNTMLSLDFTTSVAASILTASHRAGTFTRLLTSDGRDSGFDRTSAHWESTLRNLAGATPITDTNLALTIRRLGRGTPGSVAVVATSVTHTELQALSWLGARLGHVTLVIVDRAAFAGTAVRSVAVPAAPHVRVARITDAESFPAAWASATVRSSRRARSAAR